MKYIELSEQSSLIIFSKEAVQSMRLKEGSGLLIFSIAGQKAFGIQERKPKDGEIIKLAYCQKPTRFSKKLIAIADEPSPAFLLWKLGIDAKGAKLPLKEKVNNKGQIINYIGEWETPWYTPDEQSKNLLQRIINYIGTWKNS